MGESEAADGTGGMRMNQERRKDSNTEDTEEEHSAHGEDKSKQAA